MAIPDLPVSKISSRSANHEVDRKAIGSLMLRDFPHTQRTQVNLGTTSADFAITHRRSSSSGAFASSKWMTCAAEGTSLRFQTFAVRPVIQAKGLAPDRVRDAQQGGSSWLRISALARPVKGQGTQHSRSTGGVLAPLSLHARRRVLHFRAALLNSFKHILHNAITSHGMKSECFFPFHSSTRIKALA